MEKKTNLGVAAISLAAAATMIAPTTASAVDICDSKLCPGPGPGDDVFNKVDPFLKIGALYEDGLLPANAFFKIEGVFLKLDGIEG